MFLLQHLIKIKFIVLYDYNLYAVLVFSKCFLAGYYTFSQLKFKVNQRINS